MENPYRHRVLPLALPEGDAPRTQLAGRLQWLSSASEDGQLYLFDIHNGNKIKNWKSHGGAVLSVPFPHYHQVITTGRNYRLAGWRQDGHKLMEVNPKADLPLRAVFDSDSRLGIVGSWRGEVQAWNVPTKQKLIDYGPSP